MQLRRIKTATALIATAAGVAAFAGSAQAAVVDNYWLDMSGNPDLQFRDGNMAFDWEHSVTSGHLTGTMNVIKNGDNARFRVALQSEDGHGTQIGDTTYDNEAGTLVRTTGAKDIPVDMDATAAAGVRQVKVLLQKQIAGGSFVTKDYTYATVLTHSDDVTILGAGIDVGGPGFANHAPTDPASVWWTFEDDGQLTAHFTGTLHLDHGFAPRTGSHLDPRPQRRRHGARLGHRRRVQAEGPRLPLLRLRPVGDDRGREAAQGDDVDQRRLHQQVGGPHLDRRRRPDRQRRRVATSRRARGALQGSPGVRRWRRGESNPQLRHAKPTCSR